MNASCMVSDLPCHSIQECFHLFPDKRTEEWMLTVWRVTYLATVLKNVSISSKTWGLRNECLLHEEWLTLPQYSRMFPYHPRHKDWGMNAYCMRSDLPCHSIQECFHLIQDMRTEEWMLTAWWVTYLATVFKNVSISSQTWGLRNECLLHEEWLTLPQYSRMFPSHPRHEDWGMNAYCMKSDLPCHSIQECFHLIQDMRTEEWMLTAWRVTYLATGFKNVSISSKTWGLRNECLLHEEWLTLPQYSRMFPSHPRHEDWGMNAYCMKSDLPCDSIQECFHLIQDIRTEEWMLTAWRVTYLATVFKNVSISSKTWGLRNECLLHDEWLSDRGGMWDSAVLCGEDNRKDNYYKLAWCNLENWETFLHLFFQKFATIFAVTFFQVPLPNTKIVFTPCSSVSCQC